MLLGQLFPRRHSAASSHITIQTRPLCRPAIRGRGARVGAYTCQGSAGRLQGGFQGSQRGLAQELVRVGGGIASDARCNASIWRTSRGLTWAFANVRLHGQYTHEQCTCMKPTIVAMYQSPKLWTREPPAHVLIALNAMMVRTRSLRVWDIGATLHFHGVELGFGGHETLIC